MTLHQIYVLSLCDFGMTVIELKSSTIKIYVTKKKKKIKIYVILPH